MAPKKGKKKDEKKEEIPKTADEIFTIIDKDGSGLVTLDELTHYLKE